MAAILQRVTHQHRGDGEQAEQAKGVHGIVSPLRTTDEIHCARANNSNSSTLKCLHHAAISAA
jgi:hypothetical protein